MIRILGLIACAAFAADHNHHLHNFGSGAPAATHARAMGYRFVTVRTPDSVQPEGIGRIALHNANVGPIRVYVRKSDGKIFIGYHAFLRRRQDNLNPVALLHGLKRENTYSPTYPLTAEDFEILRNYSAARRDASGLQFESATEAVIREHFFTAWPMENASFRSFNLLGNWQSRKVVDKYVAAFTGDYPWERYEALFFDYAFVNRHLADYDRGQHFLQHLDACGTAGVHGAWFGWYGEDNVDLKDAAGRLVFTNDLQLLRAIPNWDNLAGVAVPPFGRRSSADLRHWDGDVYRSPRSYASKDVIWSQHPETGELFAVFRSMEGRIRLRGAAAIERAVFADSWFAVTAESAVDALDVGPDGSVRLKPGQESRLGRGLRITVRRDAPGETEPPGMRDSDSGLFAIEAGRHAETKLYRNGGSRGGGCCRGAAGTKGE